MEIEILKRLISFRTITPNECGIYQYIKELLNDFEVMELDKDEVKNIFLYKKYGSCDKNALHICFAGHIDVVPPGDSWDSDPFVATINDGYIYGRGSQDMKGGIAAFLSAIMENKHFNGIVSVLLTSDEEGPAINGTRYALEKLKDINLLPDYAIVAEPTSINSICDMIKIGRRGSINGKLTIHGKQGHVAYPSKCINPVDILSTKLHMISGYDLDDGDCDFESSKIVVTDIRGGMEVVNVTPNEVRLMFNIRNSTKTTIEDVRCHFVNLFQDIPHTLELSQSSKPFLSSKNGVVASSLIESIHSVLGKKPTLSTSGGTSDARYFAEYGVEVVECGVCNDRIHAINERAKIDDVKSLKLVFGKFLNFIEARS